MAEKVIMIALSPTMESGTISSWLKKEGEEVSSGDVLCEVETDKAAMDYESSQEGILLKILVPEGNSAKVGESIAVIGAEGEDINPVLKEISEETAPPVTEPSPQAAPEEKPGAVRKTEIPPAQAPPQTGLIPASPLARIIAQEKGIDLSTVIGTGPGGRIVKRDIEKAGTAAPETRPRALRREEKPVSQKRKIIAQRLSESKFSAPHYYLRIPVIIDPLLQARKKLNEKREKKVSLNAFLIKLTAEALKRHPAVNSSWKGDTILTFGSADIGLAVAQEDGLITPVVRNCSEKGILEIEDELSKLIEKARTNKLSPEEYSDATFTISNLGSYGIEEFTAIINPPGSAILAVGAGMKEVYVDEKDIYGTRTVMRLTLSCDHRVIDGAKGAEFLGELKSYIEDPIRVLY